MARGDTLLSPSKNPAINAMRSTNRGGGPKANAAKVAGKLAKGVAGKRGGIKPPRRNFVGKNGRVAAGRGKGGAGGGGG